MRRIPVSLSLICIAAATLGCAPQALFPDDDYDGDVLNAILSATGDPPDVSDDPSGDSDPSGSTATSPPADASRIFSDTLTGDGNYRLFELGAGSRRDEWAVTANGLMSGPFVVVVFDADMNLLMRTYLSYANSLRHVLREDTEQLYLGIMPPSGQGGGTFDLKAIRRTDQAVPAPAPQLVWVNFASGEDVRIRTRDSVSFAPFDGAMIGDEYAAHTQEMKNVILREMRDDYASYNVVIMSSDEGPPPTQTHATVHFGGSDSGLLGLADSVDNYNQDPGQLAIVYVENFAPYWTMQLEPDEMAVMIANVASHELGHLLGLYHTRDPDDLMDTTGSAWDLAEDQSFMRAPLERTVFATGWENSPHLLRQIVGSKPGGAAKPMTRHRSPKSAIYKAIRRFAQEEIVYTCGTCLSLDHE